jgi:hypothetical protein
MRGAYGFRGGSFTAVWRTPFMDRRVCVPALVLSLLVETPALRSNAAADHRPPAGQVWPRDGGQARRGGFVGKLGPILTVPGAGGTIFGFDIDQHGGDAVVDEFDQASAKITKVIASLKNSPNDYVVDGIFGADVGLVDNEISRNGGIVPDYRVLDPVTGGAFTGSWMPPVARDRVLEYAENQTTSTSILFAIELDNGDAPNVIVSNIAAGTFAPVIRLDPNAFALGAQPQLAQDFILDDAVLASSPDFGRPGGTAPLIETIDLSSHAIKKFNGFNNGPFGAGYVNGLAVDSNTHIACTTTELNSSVEFYDLQRQSGITVSLPDTTTGDQLNSGWSVAVDTVNRLFFVTQPFDSVTKTGSAIYAYNEHGNLIESIHGFAFSFPSIAINPSLRIGYVNGPAANQLREFTY